MAFVLPDRTRETLASAPGTGNATTAGATQGAQSIASKLTSNGDTTWATIDNGTAWETNTITRVSAGVYSRGTPFDSSNAGALVNFLSGTLEIFPDIPGTKLKVLERLAWSAGAILSVGDGTVSLPAWSFSNDTDCGLYRIGANNLGLAVNGAKVVDYSTTGLSVTGDLTWTGAASTTTTPTVTSVTGSVTATCTLHTKQLGKRVHVWGAMSPSALSGPTRFLIPIAVAAVNSTFPITAIYDDFTSRVCTVSWDVQDKISIDATGVVTGHILYFNGVYEAA